ncbi:DUF975 family protein [Bacillus sp. HMF5848]|uniref:DUF975 family protein n=1 Tax=Bacillus sp. HMF5848 TaxID=2495421 RepID=UPI000F7765C5|nr:DUF975 family protein [Bacillus sp. HMF5848]RSK25830.1 DUF975 family protein [Bacillus sp. HMF5848]
MWRRSELKSHAKEALRGTYWKALIVCIVLAFVNGGSSSSSGSRGFNEFNNVYDGELGLILIPLIILVVLFALVIGLAIRIILGYPLEVGGMRYFVRASKKEANLGNLVFAFNKNHYISIVKAMLYKAVLVFLWFLLLIIPGIIKAYAYSLVPYILSDNPNIGYKQAVALSNKMTKGEKMDIFVLDLSFLGWFILGALAFGVGILFVLPYYNATKAELYLVLRQKALDNGLCTSEELNMR